MTPDFIREVVLEKHIVAFLNEDLQTLLVLQPVTVIKVSAQISGNCSWANVEACILVLFFLMCTATPDISPLAPHAAVPI